MTFSKKVGVSTLVLALALCGSAVGVTAASAAGSAKDDAKTDYVWSMDLDCSLCHEKEWASIYGDASVEAADGDTEAVPEAGEKAADQADTADESDVEQASDAAGATDENPIEAYGALHAENFAFECTTCHSDEEGMAEAHAKLNNGRESKRLKKTSVDSEMCLTCHDQEALAEATADVEVLVDNEGTVVNPHDLPDVADHAGISCTSCHKVHTGADRTLEQTANATCTNCHHTGTYECGTCH